MKSIKPGRGPSAMGAVGSIFSAIFGIIWTIAAASMGAPVFFWLFGVVFVILGIVQAIYNFKNATGENRYSEFDIVDSTEEPDPLAQKLGLSLQESFYEIARIRRCSGTSRRLERNSATAPTAAPAWAAALHSAASAASVCRKNPEEAL